jgi:hypothetical protein
MPPVIESIATAAALFVGLLIAQVIGHSIGRRRHRASGGVEKAASGVIDGAVFALLGLLLAFTFSGASARYDLRRDLLVDHVNALGTAWLRIDMLQAEDQAALRALFPRYLDALISAPVVYASADAATRAGALAAVLAEVQNLQDQIWAAAMAVLARDQRPQVATLLLPPLNESFDLGSSRLAATRFGIQAPVIWLLFGVALLAAALAGNAQADNQRPDRLHLLVFAALISAMLWFILDFDSPRVGIINLGAYDELLVELRERMP